MYFGRVPCGSGARSTRDRGGQLSSLLEPEMIDVLHLLDRVAALLVQLPGSDVVALGNDLTELQSMIDEAPLRSSHQGLAKVHTAASLIDGDQAHVTAAVRGQ